MSTVPGYWMHETSGRLRPAVARLLNGKVLTPVELALMRAYLRQWMNGPWIGDAVPELRDRVDRIQTAADLRSWLDDALDVGIDPL